MTLNNVNNCRHFNSLINQYGRFTTKARPGRERIGSLSGLPEK
jgi:hypothetical protein